MKNSKLIFPISTLVLAIFISLFPLLVKIRPHISTQNINWGLSIAIAQDLRPEAVAEEVYKIIPSLPRENQYLSQETGEVDLDNTLMSRLVRYHEYVKNRPLNYRLDWKLTLADYLGVNEPIRDFRYPGSTTLQLNPLEGDRAIITSLSRRQRNELVDTLVSIYNGEQPNSSTSNSPTSEEQPPSNNSNPIPNLPQPGDAELLLP
ncbi:MAG: hypothetical protein AB4206_06420 [Xenococcaceae cyanobacterium]